MAHRLIIDTSGPGFYEITGRLPALVSGDGVLSLFIRHTSASLLIQENADPDVQSDLAGFLERLVPPANHPDMRWLRHVMEGPDDMPAHIKAAFLPTSLQIPVLKGRLGLGTWQGVYLLEHRARPHRREVLATMIPAMRGREDCPPP